MAISVPPAALALQRGNPLVQGYGSQVLGGWGGGICPRGKAFPFGWSCKGCAGQSPLLQGQLNNHTLSRKVCQLCQIFAPAAAAETCLRFRLWQTRSAPLVFLKTNLQRVSGKQMKAGKLGGEKQQNLPHHIPPPLMQGDGVQKCSCLSRPAVRGDWICLWLSSPATAGGASNIPSDCGSWAGCRGAPGSSSSPCASCSTRPRVYLPPCLAHGAGTVSSSALLTAWSCSLARGGALRLDTLPAGKQWPGAHSLWASLRGWPAREASGLSPPSFSICDFPPPAQVL